MIAAAIAFVLAQAAATPTGGPTIQQAFDAATALDESGSAEARLTAWQALERRVAGNRRTVAIVRVREGTALLKLQRREEAAAALKSGLADLPAGDATLRGDRVTALLDLALLADSGLDYTSAVAGFRAAEPFADTPSDKLTALLGQVRTGTYVDPDQAVAAAGRLDALLASVRTEGKVAGVVRSYEAELSLNRGDVARAKAQAAAAVKLLGGLTERTHLDDVSARSDYAIAALLGGDGDSAREYLALTGAGRLPKGSFDPASGMHVPDCGGDAAFKPADMAVVEFSINDDGTVFQSRPVYAQGGGKVALEFARAVNDWSWTPDQVKALPLFFRYRIRVELRCSTAFERPSIATFLDAALGRWLADHDVPLPAPLTGSDAAVLPGERAQLAAIQAKDGPYALALVPVLHTLARNGVVARDESNALAQRELAILDLHAPSPVARLAAERRVWDTAGDPRSRFIALGVPAIAAVHYDADPEARGAVRLIVADALAAAPDQARPYLAQVAHDTTLDKDSPVRVAALVRLASLEQQAGNAEAARAAFQQSGVPPETCAMIDSPPHVISVGGTFPEEAIRWGFEGWTQVQFDVQADGKVTGQRAVISYPPFVFSKAGAAAMGGARYSKTYRPGGEPGCGGATERVRFVIPTS